MQNTYCLYCHNSDPTPLNVETITYSGLEITMLRNGSNALRVRHFEDAQCTIFDHQEVVLINYCPMCGRSMRSRKQK